MSNWDVVVLGLGGVGSSAAYHLAKSGLRTLGIDRNPPVHPFGSSHGQSRAIRQAYFEDPAYVPMLRRAYDLWDELEQESGRKLFHRTSIVQIGPANGVVVPGVLRSAAEHGLAVEEIAMPEASKRFPVMHGDVDWRAVIETNAGFLLVEECVRTHLELAAKHGAELQHCKTVNTWKSVGNSIEIQTDDQTIRTDRLVIAAGAWSNQLLSELGIQFKLLRKYQYWFPTSDRRYSIDEGFPCFFYETPEGYFYGFPKLDAAGVKVARHSGGQPINHPTTTEQVADPEDLRLVCEFNAAHLSHLEPAPSKQSKCFYTVTADEHFLIDTHPDNSRIVIVAGLSGHGFKFTSTLGELAASIAQEKNDGFVRNLFRINRLLSA